MEKIAFLKQDWWISQVGSNSTNPLINGKSLINPLGSHPWLLEILS